MVVVDFLEKLEVLEKSMILEKLEVLEKLMILEKSMVLEKSLEVTVVNRIAGVIVAIALEIACVNQLVDLEKLVQVFDCCSKDVVKPTLLRRSTTTSIPLRQSRMSHLQHVG